MASQAAGFGALGVGAVVLTMGITNRSVRETLSGKAGHVKPEPHIGSGGEGSSPSSTSAPPVKGASPAAERFVQWANSQLGVKSGSREEQTYAHAVGISGAAAWCAAFVTAGLKRLGIQPPKGPASVADWQGWSGGESLGTDLAKARPGDLLRFGGQHIAIYLGGGKMISGNWSNEVGIAQVPPDVAGVPLSEIIRVKGLYGAAAKALGRGANRALRFEAPTRSRMRALDPRFGFHR